MRCQVSFLFDRSYIMVLNKSMSDFQFLKNPITGKWVVSAPRRSHRPDGVQAAPVCPFCPGNEANDEVYRLGGSEGDSNWVIRVISNKYPFMPYHEVIVHSPDHKKTFDTYSLQEIELILHTYRQRYNLYASRGQVYIFQNHGHAAGESIHHSHSQLVVVPHALPLDIPLPDERIYHREQNDSFYSMFQMSFSNGASDNQPSKVETEHFMVYCPLISDWPDEVWISPKQQGTVFGEITNAQIKDFAFVLSRLIQIFDLRHGKEFPFNYYIYPGMNWYLRIIPRMKVLGGFELGTGIMVNTQEPEKTMEFIKEHFHQPDFEKIQTHHKADYRKKV